MAKINLRYGGGELPENLSQILNNADEQDMRILIALMMTADADGAVREDISLEELLGLAKSEVDASLKFWRGAGLITSARAPKANKSESAAKQSGGADAKDGQKSAHRGGAVEKSVGVSPYATEELASLFERRRVTAQFIDEAQRVLGKTFNSYDTGIVAGLVDQLGFEEEAVLAILAYATRRGKKTVRYSEKLALVFYDDGLTAASDVVKRIELIERSADVIYKTRQLFGIADREPSRTEKALFEKWTQKFEYDIDVIRLAYDITVDTINKPVPKYAGSILERWYGEGLRTPEEISAYEQKQKAEKEGRKGEGEKSYELDDFFAAALQRSLEDLK